MRRVQLGRRELLFGLGATLLATPFIDLLDPKIAKGGTAAPNLLVVFTPNGTIPKLWKPSGQGSSYDFAPGSILEPLANNKGDLLICGGIDFIGFSNHSPGMKGMLTANQTPSGPLGASLHGMTSVDQAIASAVGKTTRFSSLDLGVQTSAWGGTDQTRTSYLDGSMISPEDDPASAFLTMFQDLLLAPDARASLAYKRKSVLDLTRKQIGTLRGALGREEQYKLDAHLDALGGVEKSLAGGGGCGAPTPPDPVDPYENDAFPAIGKAQMDNAILALSCGMTRVVTLQWSHTVSPTVFHWIQVQEGHHDLSHKDDADAAGVANFVATERWYAQQFAALIDKLKATPSGTGTLFDNTIVLWAKELGDSRQHDGINVPFIFAGRGGGLAPGKYVDFGGARHEKVLNTVCRLMGFEDAYGPEGTGALTFG